MAVILMRLNILPLGESLELKDANLKILKITMRNFNESFSLNGINTIDL